MIRFEFNQLKGTITQALIVVKSVEIDDFWTLNMSISTLDMSVSTLDMLLSTLDSRQLPRLSKHRYCRCLLIKICRPYRIVFTFHENVADEKLPVMKHTFLFF